MGKKKLNIKKERLIEIFTLLKAGLEVALTNEDAEALLDHWLKTGERLIKKSKTKIDDIAILPLLKRFREKYDIDDTEK